MWFGLLGTGGRSGHWVRSTSRTPEMRRMAETTRSSCFLSRTSTVMSTMAPSAARSPPWLPGCGCWLSSEESTVVSWVEHAGPVVGVDDDAHREGVARRARPLHVDLALHVVHQVLHVGAIEGMHRHALAAGDVADDGFAADGVAALGAIDQQVVDALDLDDQIAVVAGTAGAGRRSGAAAVGLGGFAPAPLRAPASAAPGARRSLP